MKEQEALEVDSSTKSVTELEGVIGINYFGTLELDWLEKCFISEWHAFRQTIPTLNKQQSAIPEKWENQIFRIPCYYNTQNVYFSTKKIIKQESMACSQENLTVTTPGKAQTLEILDRDFKSTVLNMLNELKETMDKELKEIGNTMSEQNENISKENL